MNVLKICVSYINKAKKYEAEMSDKYSSLRNKTGLTGEEAENPPSKNTLVTALCTDSNECKPTVWKTSLDKEICH